MKTEVYIFTNFDYLNRRERGLQMRLNFIPIHVFRETPQVSFFEADIKG